MNGLKNKGWVRLHRKIEDNPLWLSEPFTRGQAWVDLFLGANHKDSKMIIRGNIVPLKRGQLGWSEVTMTKRWTWSRAKVRRFLKYLENEQQIVQQKDRYITTIITILKYDEHQTDTADDTAERQQTIQRTIHKQEVKNVKNVKNNNPPTPQGGEGFENFWKIYPRKVNKVGAKRSWTRLRPSKEKTNEIIQAVEKWKQTEQWQKDGGQFIPHPTTFLNQQRWENIPEMTKSLTINCN